MSVAHVAAILGDVAGQLGDPLLCSFSVDELNRMRHYVIHRDNRKSDKIRVRGLANTFTPHLVLQASLYDSIYHMYGQCAMQYFSEFVPRNHADLVMMKNVLDFWSAVDEGQSGTYRNPIGILMRGNVNKWPPSLGNYITILFPTY